MGEQNGRNHTYHAEAAVLHGRLQLPLMQDIKPQAYARLGEEGGYLSQHAEDYRLEGIISFRSAYTQVAGNDELPEKDGGWTTVATSVIEGVNILDVVTADRIVAQITTHHPRDGYVPSIHFLGTRFENLRIAGHKVNLDLNHDCLGARPKDDTAYTRIEGWIEKLRARIALPEHIETFPDAELDGDFVQSCKVPGEDDGVEQPDYEESTESSLASNVTLDGAGAYPGECFNHVINVPDFGKIYLATVHVKHSKFRGSVPKKTSVTLSMLKTKMGCMAAGATAMGHSGINAGTRP